MKQITSRRNAIIAQYRAAAQSGSELMLLDGSHLVREALAAGVPIRHAVVVPDGLEREDVHDLVTRLEQLGVETVQGSPAVMAAASPVRSPSAIVAIADRPSHAPDAPYKGDRPLLVIACDVQDPGNLGAIVRVAEAGGASGLIAAGLCADPFGWKALRGSMGSALRLPVTRHHDPQEAVALAKRLGCRVVATVPRGGRPLYETSLERPLALLIGGEGGGLPDTVLETADEQVTIPMEGPVESLNTAVAAALLVYEALRQHTHGSALPR